jgi:exo-1,4-beta-D-glucosaminidase
MPKLLSRCSFLALLLLVVSPVFAADMPLHAGWNIVSACKITDTGETISSMTYHPKGWIAATVPTTVVAAQVAAGQLPDPYYGLNLRKFPGEDYPIGKDFENLHMPQDSPYRCGFWFRKAFSIPPSEKGKTLWLRFEGINYSADIWVNGKRIADRSQVAGAYRTYEFNVTNVARPGAENAVAVEVFAPKKNDLGINWVDWNPGPPDKDMGLWGPVSLATSGPVTVRSPMVATHFTDDSLKEADLTVYAELRNGTDQTVKGVLSGTVAGVPVSQTVELAPQEKKTVSFSPEKFAQLHVHNPKVWWPWQMGEPNLETLTLRFTANGKVSDEQSVRFGIREVTSELTDQGHRLFRVNGKRILVRGGGWSQDMLLRQNPERLQNQIRLVRDLRLNTIRLEGKLETQAFFNLTDQKGILVMAGWCCCDMWEHWKEWTPETLAIAKASLRSQILRLRSHASLLVWLNGSDNAPPANVESAYLEIEKEMHWPNPTLSAASQRDTTVSGPNGVKMTGPYDYVAPSYWLADTSKYGGAWGFNTETSPGPAIPTISSLKKFIPADEMWPPNKTWSYHYGGGDFKELKDFNSALAATYGATPTLQEYVRVAQTMSYDAERAMFEAYGRNKYTSTGVIQWMLNNAWPSMIWHLYDYYLDTGGGYFGSKKALEPIHVQYSYGDHSVWIVNSTYQETPKLFVTANVYNTDLKQLAAQKAIVTVEPDASTPVLELPGSVFSGDGTYFVQLELKDVQGKVVSRNFYWVPAKLAQWDWAKTYYTYTPALEHSDMQVLRSLPEAKVTARAVRTASGVRVELHNPSKGLAFQVAVAAQNANGENITPAIWTDNYVELMPGESRTLDGELPEHLKGKTSVVVSGWNIPEVTLPLK